MNKIQIRGAKVHNLKNVNLDLPLNKLICFSGPSGSGKSSLAFHTLLAESKRRFLNSYPNSVKFFIDRPASVDVDSIFPVLPVFGLPQINPVLGSRTVVSDLMRVTDFLQNLFFSFGKEVCPKHDLELRDLNIVDQIAHSSLNLTSSDIVHLFLFKSDFNKYFDTNFIPVRSLAEEDLEVNSFNPEHQYWEIFRFKWENLETLEKRLVDLKLNTIDSSLIILNKTKKKIIYDFKLSKNKKCPKCDFASTPIQSVSSFSPYSALGACSSCSGYGANLIYDDEKILDKDLTINEGGIKFLNFAPFDYAKEELFNVLRIKKISKDVPIKKLPKLFYEILFDGHGEYPGIDQLKKYLESKKYKPAVRVFIRKMQTEEPCSVCNSTRLNSKFYHFKISSKLKATNLPSLMSLSIEELLHFFESPFDFKENYQKKLIDELISVLGLASEMGIGHLKLLRKAKTLSSGEYQRLLLLKYLSFKGTDSLFVLDEPTVGLSSDEVKKLYQGLKKIVSQGNTVIVIDHSTYLQSQSDFVVVMGPESGKNGGEVIFSGVPEDFKKIVPIKPKTHKDLKSKSTSFIEASGIEIYGKKYPDFEIPLGVMTWITGKSGTGKSSCVVKVVANQLHKKIFKEYIENEKFEFKKIYSPKKFEDIIVISSDLNRFTSRSTVGTLTELASVIRKHFLKLPIVKRMNLKDGHLSSNSELGMCKKCEGKGINVIEMQYLEDIVIECEDCKGLKIQPVYAQISDGEMTVAEAYNLPLNQVLSKIELTPKFKRVWEYLKILNLDYLSLDRGLNTLSGGERQRIFLLSKLLKKIENSLIIFENISFGLSDKEISRLSEFLVNLINSSNTILIIDSNHFFKDVANYQLHFEPGKISQIKL